MEVVTISGLFQQRNGMNRNGNGGGGGAQGGGDTGNSNYGYGYGVNHAQGGREEITFLVPASKCGVSFHSPWSLCLFQKIMCFF